MEQVSTDSIEAMLEDHHRLIEILQSTNSVSLQATVESAFAKTLLVAVASYFENRITNAVLQIFQEETNGSDALVSFVRDQAVSRGYSSWFNWNSRNANQFFGKFGQGFRSLMDAKIRNDNVLAQSIHAFMEIGSIRNPLVHQNYAQFNLDKTVAEVHQLYESGVIFVEGFPLYIRQHINDEQLDNTN